MKTYIDGLEEARKLILKEGEDALFSVNQFSKIIARELQNIIDLELTRPIK